MYFHGYMLYDRMICRIPLSGSIAFKFKFTHFDQLCMPCFCNAHLVTLRLLLQSFCIDFFSTICLICKDLYIYNLVQWQEKFAQLVKSYVTTKPLSSPIGKSNSEFRINVKIFHNLLAEKMWTVKGPRYLGHIWESLPLLPKLSLNLIRYPVTGWTVRVTDLKIQICDLQYDSRA